MSADDFQTKYASVMESMLKSAVAETTKLFETMVDELKAEISKMKKENEDLKEKCSQFENAKRETTDDTSESETVLKQRDGSEKRDTAIQCDLGPFRAMLVEQCEPLQPSSWQNQEQQCGYDTQQYVWQEHNYENREGRDSQMAFILVKQEGSIESLQETVLKQEEVEPISSSGQVFGDKVGVQVMTSAGGIQNEGCITNQECSTAEIPLPQRNEEAQVALKLPQLGMDSSLLGVRNQSSDLEHSLSAVKGDAEKDSEIGPQISGMRSQEELITSKRHTLVVAQNQPEAELQQNEQPSNADWPRQLADIQSTEEQFSKPTTPTKDKAFDELQNGLSEVEPDLPVRRRRGRPPKKAKTMQQPVKQMCLPSSIIPAEQEVKKYPATRLREVKASSNVELVSMQGKADTDLAEKEKRTAGSSAVSVSSLSRKCSSKNKKITESQQPPMDTKDGEIQAPSTEVSSIVAKQNTPTTESLQEPSHQSRERRTSATLQDAMLLVEAMNQSTEKNVLCSPQRIAATTQTLQTVDEVPAEPGKPPILFEKEEALQATDATTTSKAVAKKEAVTPNPQHTVPPPCTAKSSVATSTTATQTSVLSVHQHHLHPPIKPISPSKQGDAVPQKIIVMSRSSAPLMPCKFAGKSPTQLPSVVSTVITAQNNGDLPTLIPTGIPPVKPSLCSTPQKTIYLTQQKSLPSTTLQSIAPPTDLQSGSLSQPKITILIPRELSAVASRKQSQAIARATRQESAKSSCTDMSPSSELMSLSQEVKVSGDPQIALDEVSSTKLNNTLDNLESHQQTASLKSVNESTETSSSSDILLGLVPTSISPLTVEQAPTAVVRLTRLSFPMSTKDAVMLSSRHSNESSETQSQEGTRKEKPSPVVISTQPSETFDICVNSKETSAADFVQASQMSEKSRTRESPPLSSEKFIVLDDSTDGEYVAAELPTFELEEEISIAVQDPTLPNVPPAVIHLMSIKSKDLSDPHVQMTKTQFLAQLAVSPIVQDQTELSTCDSVDADGYCPTTSTNDEKSGQGDSLVTKLRRHLKTHLQGRTTTTNQESCTETEILTASPKKPRLEEDSPDDQSPTIASILLNPISHGGVMNSSPDKTINDPSPISTRRSRKRKDGVRSKRTVSEPAPVSPRRLKATGGSTPINLRSSSGRNCIGSKNQKSTFVSPRRSNSTEEDTIPKKTKITSLSPRRLSSSKERGSNIKIQTTPVHPRRTNSTRDGSSPKSNTTAGCPTNSETPKTTKSTAFSPRKSGFRKNGPSPKTPNNESTSYCRRRCTYSQVYYSSKPSKSISDVFSPGRCSIPADCTESIKGGANFQSVGWLKMAEDVRSSKTGESTPAQKRKLIQDASGANENLEVAISKKLAKAAKATTEAKIKNKSAASPENMKKLSAKSVWTPPVLSSSETPPSGGKRSPNSPPIKKEAKTPNQTLVYPHSISLLPIPIKAPPVVSPLQPLSVIGWRLLKNQCGECGRVLSSSAALESHVSLHTGHRPFSCKLCGKRFPDSKGLKRHGRVHRNGRIHICKQCGKGFVYSFGLTKHLQMVHSRIKPFVCQVCNKGFFSKRDVEAHIRIHTGEKPFHCNLCDKKFARRTELNVHLRWHNGEKRHWCPYCGKGFLDINNLKRHKYIHTGEKPHSCPHCPKHFTQSGHLKKHVKNVHKME